MLTKFGSGLQPYALGLLRIFAALNFITHGLQEFGFFDGKLREFGQLLWFAGVNEVIFGTLLLLGIFARPAALLMSGQMAIAFFRSHFPGGFWPIQNGGELAVLYCFIWLLIFAAGPGKFSLEPVLFGRGGKHRSGV